MVINFKDLGGKNLKRAFKKKKTLAGSLNTSAADGEWIDYVNRLIGLNQIKILSIKKCNFWCNIKNR